MELSDQLKTIQLANNAMVLALGCIPPCGHSVLTPEPFCAVCRLKDATKECRALLHVAGC